jgi:gliding motility-associated-like protein
LATTPYATPAAATAGTYYIKGTDLLTSCYTIQPVTVTINASPTVTTTHVNVACFGGATGTATAIAAGGTGVYTYSWNTIPVQTTAVATGLIAGTYIVTVDDGNSCSGTASTIITEPASSLSGSIISQTNVSVFGGNDGTVTVDGSGGTPPYQYKIGSGTYQVSGTFGALIAGNYTITVQDINLCTFDVPVTITQPFTTLSGSITSQTNVACFGASTGSITVTGSGGSIPYDYSLNGGTFQSSGTFAGLTAGTYTITVRDALLITFDINVTITQPVSALGGFIASQTNVLCFGSNTGNVTIAGSGGVSPYLYKMAGGSYQASGLFETLIADSYTVTIQDANLCTFDVTVNITQPLAILAVNTLSSTNVSCSGSANGSVNVSASGGTSPYMFSLNGGAYQASGSFSNLAASTYTITVQDANLCTAIVTVAITEPEALSIVANPVPASCPDVEDGSITLTISGGTSPYSFHWLDGAITQDRINIPTGNYRVVVTDFNSCAASLDVVVGVGASEKCLEIPTIITPNNDGFNDKWNIKNIDLFPNAEVFVYNRWGELVFHSKNLSANQWNGTYKGKLLPTDSYHYILYLNDGSKPRSGVISIIR